MKLRILKKVPQAMPTALNSYFEKTILERRIKQKLGSGRKAQPWKIKHPASHVELSSHSCSLRTFPVAGSQRHSDVEHLRTITLFPKENLKIQNSSFPLEIGNYICFIITRRRKSGRGSLKFHLFF
jgi:hypothetical protein